MDSQQRLKEANYVHRGEDGEYIKEFGQCGLSPCDYSKMIRDNKTGREYRYCTKLQIPVDEYDSCKYHSDEEFMGLVGQMSNLLQKENKTKGRANQRQTPAKHKKKYILPIFAILCFAVLLYILMK